MQRRVQGQPLQVRKLRLSTAALPSLETPFDEDALIESPMVLDIQIGSQSMRSSFAMIDSGALAVGFIDSDFAQSLDLPLQPITYPRSLDMFDGTTTTAGLVTHLAHARLLLGGGHHSESISLFVTKLADYPVILGRGWLRRHNPMINFETNALQFPSETCRRKCLSPLYSSSLAETPALEVRCIGAAPFARLATKRNHVLFAVTMQDLEKALQPKKYTDPATILPSEYHEYLDVFSRQAAEELPPHRASDHRIRLTEGSSPPYGPLYGMSQTELLVLKNYLDENLKKNFIRPSSSPAASPVLFVKKPGGGLRFCVDYRGLNAITVKNRYPLPLIRETLDHITKARYFTKLDVIAAFNKLRMAEGDEWLTAFRTRYGLYEYLVMPFGLCNAPSSFQNYINDQLQDYLDNFATAYIDDILIYSNSLEEHKVHVQKVLERLRKANLQIDIDKCEFHVQEVKYLGLIITTRGVRMDPEKLTAIRE